VGEKLKHRKENTMKKLWILLAIVFAMSGCVTGTQPNINALKQISEALDPYVETLAKDWPKASGAIRGALDPGCLPANILEKMNEIDSWWKDDDGNWIPSGEICLNEYQRWYIAGARIAQMGPILQTIIQQYAPGLLALPQVMAGLAFLGL